MERVWKKDEIEFTPPIEGFLSRHLTKKSDSRFRKRGHEVGRREQKQFWKVGDHVGDVRAPGLELIRKSTPPRPDLPHQLTLGGLSHLIEHGTQMHRDQHLVELQRVDVDESPVYVEPESTERSRLGNPQLGVIQRP